MKFGLVVAKDIKKAPELAKKVKEFLVTRGHKVLEEKNLKGADVVVTLGGDGTLIHVACEYVELGVPFVGINAGTLGFLTAAEENGWQEALEKLIKGDYVISERMTLEAEIVSGAWLLVAGRKKPGTRNQELGASFRALNEIVIKGMYRVVDLEILVDGEKFLGIVGDGVIVATQTGSTAYSLSAGGPIVDPEVDCFLITPINAVGLPIPSIALSPNDTVEIKLKEGDDVSLIIDGQEHTRISQSQSVKVGRGEYRVKFAYFDKHHFLKSLNAKFGLALRPIRLVQGE